MSQRRASSLAQVSRSVLRYRSKRGPDSDVREQLNRLAVERPRFGYRRLTVLLHREGLQVNHKRVFRIYQEEGLAVRRKRRKRRAHAPRERLAPATEPNQRWSMDFVSDTLESGRTIRVLTVVDSCSRLSPAIEVDQNGISRITREPTWWQLFAVMRSGRCSGRRRTHPLVHHTNLQASMAFRSTTRAENRWRTSIAATVRRRVPLSVRRGTRSRRSTAGVAACQRRRGSVPAECSHAGRRTRLRAPQALARPRCEQPVADTPHRRTMRREQWRDRETPCRVRWGSACRWMQASPQQGRRVQHQLDRQDRVASTSGRQEPARARRHPRSTIPHRSPWLVGRSPQRATRQAVQCPIRRMKRSDAQPSNRQRAGGAPPNGFRS